MTSNSAIKLRPTLKADDIVNGMMQIEITNYDEFYDYDLVGHFMFSYKFKFEFPLDGINDMRRYHNNKWKHSTFDTKNIAYDDIFAIKVPLFLLPYSLEYNLCIQCDDFSSTSINYIIDVPSIQIETKHKIGDYIQYILPNILPSTNILSGTILEINDNNFIKIKQDLDVEERDWFDGKPPDIVTVHTSKTYRDSLEYRYVIDITDKMTAQTDLILRTKNETQIGLFCEIKNCLFDFYWNEMPEIEVIKCDFKHLSDLIAIEIYKFLYVSDYKCRVKCLLGDTDLFYQVQWEYFLLRSMDECSKGKVDPQEARINEIGFTCDICRIELSSYEFVYHCSCDLIHDFCVTCIHSIMRQYYQMKQLIAELLKDVINDDCIEEIIAYSVGQVVKFDVKHVNTDHAIKSKALKTSKM